MTADETLMYDLLARKMRRRCSRLAPADIRDVKLMAAFAVLAAFALLAAFAAHCHGPC
jgi:hypothetical protein